MPERDYQYMACAHREDIPPGITEIVSVEDVFCMWITKRAIHLLHTSDFLRPVSERPSSR